MLAGGHSSDQEAADEFKRPRGFCVRLSRAVGSNSRCFKHLVKRTRMTMSPGARKSNTNYNHNNHSDSDNNHNNHEYDDERSSGARHEREHELVYVRLETLGDQITNLTTEAVNERLLEGLLQELMGYAATRATRATGATGATGAPGADPASATAGLATDHVTINEIATQIAGSAASAASSNLDDEQFRARSCQLAVEKLLCRLVYPTCHFRQSDVSALVRPPCREDCLLARDSICPNLNWAKFSRTLREALTRTLMTTLNPLGLVAEGDPRATAAISRRDLAAHIAHSLNPLQSPPPEASPIDNASSGFNLSSSLHFYWPHERALERCESLPPLRPAYDHHEQGYHQEQSSSAARDHWAQRLMISRKHNWPVCSNARLTQTNAIADALPSGHVERRASVVAVASDKSRSLGATLSPGCSPKALADKSNYLGTHNTTRSGRVCQSWVSQSPHKHKMSNLLFDNMKDARNYCRNPGGLERMAWCYTQDPNVRWEFCGIEKVC